MSTPLTESRMKAPDLLLDELVELREHVVVEGEELMAQWRPALKRRAFLPSAVNLGRTEAHQANKTSRLRALRAEKSCGR